MKLVLAAPAALLALVAPSAASGQRPPPTPTTPTAAPELPQAVRPVVRAPGAEAPDGRLALRATGGRLPLRVEIAAGTGWRPRGEPLRRRPARLVLCAPGEEGLLRVRVRSADGRVSATRRVRVRPLVLAAVGDVNLGAAEAPGRLIDAQGPAAPWSSVGPRLRAADLAFANLECAVSTRGTPWEKTYTFRGRPSSLPALRTAAGLDVVNLANNHAVDYGRQALLDTIRGVRAQGIVPVGAGASEAAAHRPVVVERLGLKVAFVGFSEILPFEFRATGSTPGTAWAFPGRVTEGVRRAKAQADVVIATFHWGIERDTRESAGQRALARAALDAGATAVIGAHPHVLQPIRRPRGRLIAYSLGNFVFGATSPLTARTGILEVQLARGEVRGDRLIPATIVGGRPVLRR